MLYPMFAMVLLTFVVGIHMFKLRLKAVKSGDVRLSYFRLNTGAEPPVALELASRNYSNLFEVPVLFYTAGAVALALQIDSIAITIIGWLFVVTRITHSWIHLTSNNVIRRMQAFMAGNICVVALWIFLVAHYASR